MSEMKKLTLLCAYWITTGKDGEGADAQNDHAYSPGVKYITQLNCNRSILITMEKYTPGPKENVFQT